MRRLRTARQLCSARKRLRDAAAGAFAVAEAETWARAARRDVVEAERQQLLEASPARLMRASTGNELLIIEEERQLADRLLMVAEQERREAAKVSEVHRQALARRESELRTAEHVLEEVLEERDALALRTEQHALDDLSAARARRDG